jgi:hypothetical protein
MKYLEFLLLIAPVIIYFVASMPSAKPYLIRRVFRFCSGLLAVIIFYSWMINIGFIDGNSFVSESIFIGYSFINSILSFVAIAIYIAMYDVLQVLLNRRNADG